MPSGGAHAEDRPCPARSSATDTSKLANTSATAASTGADLNGKAARDAALRIRQRLSALALELLGGEIDDADALVFADNQVWANDRAIGFASLVQEAYFRRIQYPMLVRWLPCHSGSGLGE